MKTAALAALLVLELPACCPAQCFHANANTIKCGDLADSGCPPPPLALDGGVTVQTSWPCDSCYSLRVWPDDSDVGGATGPRHAVATCQAADGGFVPAIGPDSADWYGSATCANPVCCTWKDFPVTPGTPLKIVAYGDDAGQCLLDQNSFDVQEWLGCGWSYTDAYLNPDPLPGDVHVDRYLPHSPLVRVLSAGGGFHLAVCAAPQRACTLGGDGG